MHVEGRKEKVGKVLEMKVFQNMSYKEIAERLGISQKTVEIHMGKALKFLKDKVKRGWEILLSLLSF
mgnify:CR=1 FL=1